MMGPEPMARRASGACSMRRIAVTRISLAVADGLRAQGSVGTIESVYRSAINIRWHGGLLTVAQESVGGLPNGVLVSSPMPLDRIGLAAEMAVRVDGANLVVPAASLSFTLGAATTWSAAMPMVPGLAPTDRAARADVALRFAAVHAPPIGLGPLIFRLVGGTVTGSRLCASAAVCLASVLDAMRDGRPTTAVAAARPLIGLGPGATPSGDDLLVGFAAGLATIDHPLARSFAAGVALEACGRTTSLAEAFLAHAGRLEFAERVHRAAVGVLDTDPIRMRAAVTGTLAWGASSGADLLVGLLLGIQADAPGIGQRLRTSQAGEPVAA